MADVDASIDREQTMLAVVKQYFVSADAGHANVLDLFTHDVQIYFPKFGNPIFPVSSLAGFGSQV